MSRRAASLPIRSLASANTFSAQTQWTCRRCIATQPPLQADSPPPTYDPTLPFAQRIGPDGQPYSLTPTDRVLKKVLKQRIPVQYLQHSTSEILPAAEKEQREQTVLHKKVVGVVVSSGKMDKTVTVRVGGQTWNKRIGKVWRLLSRR
jgi:small subunit ribosomal protein S17